MHGRQSFSLLTGEEEVDFASFRLFSLLDTMRQMLERVIYSRLLPFRELGSFFSKKQPKRKREIVS